MNAAAKKPGVSRAKLALVALLSIALAAVWGPQLMSIGEPPLALQGVPPLATGTLAPRLPAPRPLSRTLASPHGLRPRPAIDKPAPTRERTSAISVAEAVKCDPFRLPDWSPEAIERASAAAALAADDAIDPLVGEAPPEEVDPKQRLEELRRSGVGMILVSRGGRSATIGDRTVREGDEIDGFRVVEITPSAVLLSPNTPRKPTQEPRDAP
jgi:hypothetical protein